LLSFDVGWVELIQLDKWLLVANVDGDIATSSSKEV
jgi:hypothetical protein